jgi:hypothetical protein
VHRVSAAHKGLEWGRRVAARIERHVTEFRSIDRARLVQGLTWRSEYVKKFTEKARRWSSMTTIVAGLMNGAAPSRASATPVLPMSAERPPVGAERSLPCVRASRALSVVAARAKIVAARLVGGIMRFMAT